MAYLSVDEVQEAYEAACEEATQWREEYDEYERLANNGLLEGLGDDLPEVNDGSLAASLFKLAKRVIKKSMKGRATALDRDDQWVTELANIYWEKKILPNANSKASPRRKWKDAARKAAIYGSQPVISLFVERGSYSGADFIVPYVQDVKLEAGKDSDADSDIIFWDIYMTKLGLKNFIEDAEGQIEDAKQELAQWKERKAAYDEQKAAYDVERELHPDLPAMPDFEDEEPKPYNQFNMKALKELTKHNPADNRPGNEISTEEKEKGTTKSGYHFYIAFQRGVGAPFMMMSPHSGESNKSTWLQKWSNPDPSGDVPVHYLYCYQDFINPYGIGIVKLAGGTQNVLDYMRKVDVLATQIGVMPPRLVQGDEGDIDEDDMPMTPNANWYVGQTQVNPWQIANGVYNQLPERMAMYQTSLQKVLPTGDTTISGTDSGDPGYSKTPAGVKMAAANLSIDDEDFSENVDECYEAVARSMINIQFANMQGSDILGLSEEERQILQTAGIPFEANPDTGEMSNEIEVIWDNARATFDFEMDADADKTTDDATRLEGLTVVAEFLKDPATQQFLASGMPIMLGSKKLDPGELVGEIIHLTTDNDKILTDVTPEEMEQTAAMQQMAQMGGGQADPMTGQPLQPDMTSEPNALTPEEEAAGEQIQQLAELYGIDEQVAAAMLEAEAQGYDPIEILEAMERNGLVPEGTASQVASANQPQEAMNV